MKKFETKKGSIKDLREAVNFLNTYDEDSLLCVHSETREEAYKHFKNKPLHSI